VEFSTPQSNASQPSPGEEAPRRYRTLENLFDATEDVSPEDDDMIYLLSTEEAATFAKAEKDKVWHAAMLEEMASIKANETWQLMQLPPGHRAIGLKMGLQTQKGLQWRGGKAQGPAGGEGVRAATGGGL
jgi:hypothetical protein